MLVGVLCLPGDQSHPFAQPDNKPSCMLHLLGWGIGSRGFSSLERRPEFSDLQYEFWKDTDIQSIVIQNTCFPTFYNRHEGP